MRRKINWSSVAASVAVALMVAVGSAKADWVPNFHPGTYPYDVKPSEIVPKWSETNAGEWTFNYEGVLAKAKAEGKYTLLLITAMWWCPHCQALETNVLAKDGFAQYVAQQGYYLAAIDFPYRDGVSNWCWLWDPAYREANGIGDWTPEQVADELIKRFNYQDAMHSPKGATTTNNNVLVQISSDGSTTNLVSYAAQPTTVYRRAGYPTIIVIDPDGKEAGRFSYSFTLEPEKGLDYVIDNIEIIKAAGKSKLFANPGVDGLAGEAVQAYDAVLTDADGVPTGVATIKTAKKNQNKLIAITASVQVNGGRKVSLKGETSGSEGEIINLTKKGSACVAKVKMGSESVVGTYFDGTSSYNVQGSRNVFKSRDDEAKARAATLAKGFWPIGLTTVDNGGSTFADGYTGFSATVGNKGKTKVSGTLGDGNKINFSVQAILGENGNLLVPIMEKKGAYSLMLEFAGGQLTAVTGSSVWTAAGRPAKFTATWSSNVVFTAASGAGALPSPMYLKIEGFDAATGIGGKTVTVSPADDMVTVVRNKWIGTRGVSDLNVTFKPKDGTFKGSFNFYVQDNGRPKKLKAMASGVVVDGVGYGTAVLKGIGSLPIKFTDSCAGSCSRQ